MLSFKFLGAHWVNYYRKILTYLVADSAAKDLSTYSNFVVVSLQSHSQVLNGLQIRRWKNLMIVEQVVLAAVVQPFDVQSTLPRIKTLKNGQQSIIKITVSF